MNKKEIMCYETDASEMIGKADKVLFPKSIEEVQSIVKVSDNIVPRGGGTSLMGGTIPDNSVVIDLSKMHKLINFNKTKNWVYVEAGITIRELNEKLSSIGLEFPIISINRSSTIGGMIALNCFDSRVLKYGRMRDWVEELDFVNGRGDIIKSGKTDLTDLCGMEGITGIIVRAKLRVVSKIKRSVSLFQSNNLDEVLSIARRLKSEKDAVSICLLSKEASKMAGLKELYCLIVEFDSERGKIKEKDYGRIIHLQNSLYSKMIKSGYSKMQDHKFFFDKIKGYLTYLESSQTPYFSYLGAGVIFSFFMSNEETKEMEISDLVKKMGGKLGGLGVGLKRKNMVEDFDKKIIQRVKLRYDPFGKFNKKKVIDFEPKIHMEGHLAPLKNYEIEEIKNVLKEDKKTEAEEIVPEQANIAKEEEKTEEIKEEPLKKDDEKISKEEINEQIKDYEDTFESELAPDKMHKVEEIARNISRDIVNKTIVTSEHQEIKNIEAKSEAGKRTSDEQDLINRIMFNKSKGGDKK